jgi:tRNA uridine 5-carboxymethylaminomethyl modification enzyme
MPSAGLSNEARSKLEAARPRTVGQAGRLDGLTPAALGILAAYLRRKRAEDVEGDA